MSVLRRPGRPWLPPARRGRLANLLIAACSWPLWDLLRHDLNFSKPRAREAMTAMIAAVVERELKIEVDVLHRRVAS